MKERKQQTATLTDNRIRRSAWMTVLGDAVLIVALAASLFVYISRNAVNTYNQNVENIQNIAKAESELIHVALDNTSADVRSVFRYCNGKALEEILAYLSVINVGEGEYQLLKRDESVSTDLYHVYTGYSTKQADGAFRPVVYDDTALALSIYKFSDRAEGEICFSQNFTNKTDAMRYFAAFCSISVKEDGRMQRYYLVKPQREEKLLEQLQMYSAYSDLALAICYTDGKYLARDNGYRADNFYDYLYDYNSLSIDQRNAVRASVQNDPDGQGVLTYQDYKGRDCIFAYVIQNGSEKWQTIVSVPQSEFVTGRLLSLFPLIIIIFLVVLLAYNTWRLLDIVHQLRMSVEREKVANAAKSSFLSRMSHEIRTPLNAVIGYNTIARGELTEAKSEEAYRQAEMKVMDCLIKSDVASKHLLSVINDVLDMSAIESGKIKLAHERFNFKDLMISLSTVFYSQARTKNVSFEVLFDTLTEEWFVGDQMRVNQILTNLLSNAIKFTPEGGSVVLKICQPDTVNDKAHIHFDVTDTGIGMEQEYLKHLWTPFEQADSSISRRFGGTGLGLSITKNLVDLMGGSITVQSTVGKGTAFGVDLYFERTEQPAGEKVYDFSKVNALVVDDDPKTCDYIRLLFNRCGARCSVVTSGEDALKAASAAMEKGESYSLYLMDWQMPEMNGIETVHRLRDIVGDDMPMVVLSAYDFSEVADEAREAGVTKYITKPLFQSTLFDLLADVSGAARPGRAAVGKKVDFAGARVLLAEDNQMNMEIAKRILEANGLEVESAWNGREALEKFTASPPGTYKAILMDVHMPEMNGHDASRAIRGSSHPEAATIPIIAMTADVFAEDVAEARACGMNAHIGKPIVVDTLLETLARYIH